jgi:hypothetical protein
MALIQVAWNIEEPKTLTREKKAILAALGELQLESGILITYDTKDEISEEDKQIRIIPAYEFFCLDQEAKMDILKLSKK